MLIENSEFTQIFNQKIFENSKLCLLEKLAEYPDRYISIFRPTKPRIKIIQNITQSHEIKFGDAMEKIIELYLAKCGYSILDKRMICETCEYNLDQYAEKDNTVYFIEQKVRDDHDSSKKRGQIENFEKKLEEIIKRNPNKEIKAFFYFIDPSLSKNKNYYASELQTINQNYDIECHLCYGRELFEIMGIPEIWEELNKNILLWRENLPDFPEINFDLDAQNSFEEIKALKAVEWKKILGNDKIIEQVFPVIFSNNETLKLVLIYFENLFRENPKLKIYNVICEKLRAIVY